MSELLRNPRLPDEHGVVHYVLSGFPDYMEAAIRYLATKPGGVFLVGKYLAGDPDYRVCLAITEEQERWATWMRHAFAVIDRHVPIGDIPPELDEARRTLEKLTP